MLCFRARIVELCYKRNNTVTKKVDTVCSFYRYNLKQLNSKEAVSIMVVIRVDHDQRVESST